MLYLVGVRFANRLLEPVGNNTHIDSVDIIYDVQLTLANRAGYDDRAGALTDMIQSHLEGRRRGDVPVGDTCSMAETRSAAASLVAADATSRWRGPRSRRLPSGTSVQQVGTSVTASA